MTININNLPINPQINDGATPKKPVELHTIFSPEVIANTEKAFEKMLNMKIIDANEFEHARTTIEKIKTDRTNQPQASNTASASAK